MWYGFFFAYYIYIPPKGGKKINIAYSWALKTIPVMLLYNFKLYDLFSAVNASTMAFSSIEPLAGTNFKKWKQNIEIVLVSMILIWLLGKKDRLH